jgi:hypothetical protein
VVEKWEKMRASLWEGGKIIKNKNNNKNKYKKFFFFLLLLLLFLNSTSI